MAGVGPNFGRITTNIELLKECNALAAQHGVSQNTCASMRMTTGALYKGIFYQSPSGEQINPDLMPGHISLPSSGKRQPYISGLSTEYPI